MASINGVELKTYKTFRNHEGAPIAQGNIYIDGRKAGFWSQDSWGGCDQYDNRESERIIGERAKQFQSGVSKDNKYYDIMDSADILMGAVLAMCGDEKQYKTFVKKGYNYMVIVSDGYHVVYNAYKNPITMEMLQTTKAKEFENMKKGMFEHVEPKVRIISSVNDFNITIDKDHPCPELLM